MFLKTIITRTTNLSQLQLCNFSINSMFQKSFKVDNHDEFDKKVIDSKEPVIVNFHAEWCDPCKILTPKMNSLLENSDTIHLATIDVENNLDLVETFEVKAVPAVLAFRNGVVVDKFIGLVDAKIIDDLIKKLS